MAKGGLAEGRRPCARRRCKACDEGRKHPAFIFSSYRSGRQRCMYVPKPLAPALRQAIANGRRLEEWMAEQGAEMVRDYRAGLSKKENAKSGKRR